MAITKTTIGPNSFKITVDANESVSAVIWYIGDNLNSYGWLWYDRAYNVLRALNQDGITYKYLRIVPIGTAGNATAITEIYESWNSTTHTGINRAGPVTSGQIFDDYKKTAFWVSRSSSTTIHVYANSRWFLIGSDTGSGTGLGIGGVVNNRSWTPADYRSYTTGNSEGYDPVYGTYPVSASTGYLNSYCDYHQITDYTGMSGVLEFSRDELTQNSNVPCYFWTHTGWWIDDNNPKPTTYDSNTESTNLSYWNSNFENRGANIMGLMPRNVSGQTGANAGVVATSAYMKDTQSCYLRTVTNTMPKNIFNSKNPIFDIGVKQASDGVFLGMVYGIKPSRPTGGSPSLTATKDAVLDDNFFITKSGYGTNSTLLPIPSRVAKSRGYSNRSTLTSNYSAVYTTGTIYAVYASYYGAYAGYNTRYGGYDSTAYRYHCKFNVNPMNANINGTYYDYGYRNSDPWGYGWGIGYYINTCNTTSLDYYVRYNTYTYRWDTTENSWDFRAIFYIPS